MNTPILTTTERRTALIELARSLAGRARRAGYRLTLGSIRRIGAQLDALDPASAEAPDVLDAASDRLGKIAEALALYGV